LNNPICKKKYAKNRHKNTISFLKIRFKVFLVNFIIYIQGKQIKLKKFVSNDMEKHNFASKKSEEGK